MRGCGSRMILQIHDELVFECLAREIAIRESPLSRDTR